MAKKISLLAIYIVLSVAESTLNLEIVLRIDLLCTLYWSLKMVTFLLILTLCINHAPIIQSLMCFISSLPFPPKKVWNSSSRVRKRESLKKKPTKWYAAVVTYPYSGLLYING